MATEETPTVVMLDFETVMARLKLTRAEVYRKVKDNALKSKKEGRNLLFAEPDVVAFEEKRDSDSNKLKEQIDRWTAFFKERVGPLPGDEKPPEKEEDRIKLLADLMMRDGVRLGATDLYLDPLKSGDRVLMRIGDQLQEVVRFDACLAGPLRNGLKQLAKLTGDNPPVSGTVEIKVDEVANLILLERAPTVLGEHWHLHYWGKTGVADLVSLGYTARQRDCLKLMLQGQNGLVLMARGAGPSDDFHHAMLGQFMADMGLLVVSMESGIFPRCESLVQIAVNRSDETAFAKALDTALRMAPDVLLIDQLTTVAEAKAVFQGLGAGGVVMAGVRAPDLKESLRRLSAWEIRAEVMATYLVGGIERLLLRRLCSTCRKERAMDETEQAFWGQDHGLCDPVGCDLCGDGYLARRPMFGVWKNDDDLRQAILRFSKDEAGIHAWAKENDLGLGTTLKEGLMAGDIGVLDAQRFISRINVPQPDGT